MNVKVTKKDGLNREIKITVSAKEIDQKNEAKLKQLAETIKVAGFRPGKVPVKVIQQKHGDAVMGEVLQETVNSVTQKAFLDENLKPAMQPNITIDQFEKGKDLEYTVAFEALPEIQDIDLSKIKLEKMVAKADKKAVDDAIQRVAENNKQTETIKEKRAAKKGDVLLIDFDGSVDGQARDGMKAEGHELELGSGTFIPGFEDQLIGKKAGEETEVTVTFPTPYTAKELEGKEAVFKVKIHEIKQYVTPKADNDLAKKLGLKDLKDLKEKIAEQIESEYEMYSRNRLKRALLDQLAETHKFEIPESLAKAEFDAIWNQVQQEIVAAKQQGQDVDTSDDKAMRKEYKEIADRRVRLGLILSDIGNKNNVTVEQTDIQQAMIREVQKYPGQEKQVFDFYQKNPQAMESLKAPLFEDKVVDFIFSRIDLKENIVSFEELSKDPDADRSLTKPKAKKKASEKKSSAQKEESKPKAKKKKAAKK